MKKNIVLISLSIIIVSLISLSFTNGLKKNMNIKDQQVDNNPDSLLLGRWGIDLETGNCIFWIIKDSIFFVDPLLWCTYKLEKDTIIVFIDNDFEFFKAQYMIIGDKLILKDSIYICIRLLH